MMNENEIVVVTGASGCLGHHVAKLLISLDERVSEIRCLDLREPEELMKTILERENENQARRENSAQIRGKKKRILFIKGDIRDINTVEKVLNGSHCVIHCAAKIDYFRDNNDKDLNEFESINVNGTENLLNASLRFSIGKFIHVSSFEIYAGLDTVYYATENTIPTPNWLLFGPSGSSKLEAERKVVQYSNKKLFKNIGTKELHSNSNSSSNDSLNAIIVRFPIIYGEFERHYVSKLMKIANYFNGKLRRFSNVWIRQQPIYVGNAAWSLIKAKQQMEIDQSMSGEEFHITDETTIGDPFEFVEPFLECKGLEVSKQAYPYLPVFLLLLMLFSLRKLLKMLDIFGIVFAGKKSRLQETIERDERDRSEAAAPEGKLDEGEEKIKWHEVATPQALSFMCNSNFLNRTKASLRLNYEPIFSAEQSFKATLDWYKNHFRL